MNTATPRSTFVTVLAWIYIVLSGPSTLISIMQNIMIQSVFNSPDFDRIMHSPPADMPVAVQFMLGHIKLFFLAIMLVSIVTLIASIGLLLRRNWGRLLFIAIMALGILWNVVGMFLQFWLMSSIKDGVASQPGAPDIGPFFVVMMVVGAIFALGFITLHGWIIKRLISAPVVAEFMPAGQAHP